MNLSVIFRLRGINFTLSGACASGSHAIGMGFHTIRHGYQDCIICGGAQEVNLFCVGSFDALGAFSKRIFQQILSETLVLATIAIAFGLLFAIQVPLFDTGAIQSGIYFLAMIISILFIYLIVALCALYPGVIAAKIKPADALNEE